MLVRVYQGFKASLLPHVLIEVQVFPNTQGKMLKVQSAKYQLAPGADGSLLHSPMLLRC